jgi:hypothetical protein
MYYRDERDQAKGIQTCLGVPSRIQDPYRKIDL